MRIGSRYDEFVVKYIKRNYEGKIIDVYLISSVGETLHITYRDEHGDYDDENTITEAGNYEAQLTYIQNGELYYQPMDGDVMFLSLDLIKCIKHENKLIEWRKNVDD